MDDEELYPCSRQHCIFRFVLSLPIGRVEHNGIALQHRPAADPLKSWGLFGVYFRDLGFILMEPHKRRTRRKPHNIKLYGTL